MELVGLEKTAVGELVAITQKRDKNDYDKNARLEPQICARYEVYIDCSQYDVFESDIREEYAQKYSNILMQARRGMYHVTKVQLQTVCRSKDGILKQSCN